MTHTRRRFLATVAGTAAGFGWPRGEPGPLAAAGRRKWRVSYGEDIEPVVRLIEETDRSRCVEVIGERLRRGLSYRQFMSAVFLAGLRNGGDSGYYHCVYMIHAANQLAADAPAKDQFLPLFGAMDLFKGWQAKRAKEPGHFGLRPLPGRLGPAEKALDYFDAAVRRSDPDGAEAAVLALGETLGRHRLFGVLANQGLYAGGVHHPILVANCWRVLGAMNGDHLVPTLRAMARVLALHNGLRERWFLPLRKRAESEHGALPRGWSRPVGNPSFTRELLAECRKGNVDEAVGLAVGALFRGTVRAGALWDTAHLAAAESLLRSGDGNAVHQNTRLNALHYAYQSTPGDEDRLMTLLAVVKETAESYRRDKAAGASSILELDPVEIPASIDEAAEAVLASSVKGGAVRKALALVRQPNGYQALRRAQRSVVIGRACNDAHPYKFLTANIEDCKQVSAPWRPYLAAASVGIQRGGEEDLTTRSVEAGFIRQARAVLKGL